MSENRVVPALSATSDVPAVVTETTPATTPVVETTTTTTPATTPAIDPTATPTVTPALATVLTPEPDRSVAQRISQLVQQRRDQEARADRLEKLLNDALTALAPKPTPVTPVAPSSDLSSRPARDAFATPEDYETALIAWAGTEAATRASEEFRKKTEEADAQRKEQQRIEEETRKADAERDTKAREMQTVWESRRAKALEVHPDFKEIAEVDSLPISAAMGYIIATHEDGPEIVYHLGKNPSEAARIAAMVMPGQVFPEGHFQAGLPVPNAIEQAFELGKIAAKLAPVTTTPTTVTPATTPSAATVTIAPPTSVAITPSLPSPPNPISGANANATQRTLEEVGNEGSMEDYAAKRMPQLRQERRPGRVLQ